MQFPHTLFKSAGLNATDVAHLHGVSRITGWRWLQGMARNGQPGAGVNIFLQDTVAKVSTAVQRAVADGALPDPTVEKLPPEKRAAKLKAILRKYRTASK